MAQITDQSIIDSINESADCGPLFEAIVAEEYIGSVWVHSNGEHVIFDVSVEKQFVGTMHPGTDHESVWTDTFCGWLEDGTARRGATIASAWFDDFSEALDHLMKLSKDLIVQSYRSLDPNNLAI